MKELKNRLLKKTIENLIVKSKVKRKHLGVTQEQHAEDTNISLSSVKKVESLKCYDLKIIDKYIK